MGFDYSLTTFLAYSRKFDVDFSRVVTLGRQNLNLISDEIGHILTKFGMEVTDREINHILSTGYAEVLLEYLGAQAVASIDASAYEGASIVHDMNYPVENEYCRKFSLVIDAGTLEHVFNFPTAINNCMQMVERGGHFMSIIGANNFCGHGFYQFSPELYFRIFGEGNGFRVLELVLAEVTARDRWYRVIDPSTIGKRVKLVNQSPTYMMMIAQKTSDDGCLKGFPQQSDYVDDAWKRETMNEGNRRFSELQQQKISELKRRKSSMRKTAKRVFTKRSPYKKGDYVEVNPFRP